MASENKVQSELKENVQINGFEKSSTRKSLKFKRPPATQTSSSRANQSMLRRVSSAQNNNNCSVVESL